MNQHGLASQALFVMWTLIQDGSYWQQFVDLADGVIGASGVRAGASSSG